MIKAHVFKYSQVILTKRELAIIKFNEYSGLSIPDIATMAKEEEKPNGIIDQYKTGKITTAKFRKKMNELIQEKNGNPIRDNEVFDKGWNAMCKIEPEKLTELYNLQQTHKFHIHIISNTNKLQHNYIQQKIEKAPNQPTISYTLSYKLGNSGERELYTKHFLAARDYEPVWHMEAQNDYDQNVLDILGKYYDNTTTDII